MNSISAALPFSALPVSVSSAVRNGSAATWRSIGRIDRMVPSLSLRLHRLWWRIDRRARDDAGQRHQR